MSPFVKCFAIVGLLIAFAVPVHASGIIATQKAELKQVEFDAQGQEVISFIPASLVAPGEIVRFTIEFENQDETVIDNAVLVMPIPSEMTYLSHDDTSTSYKTSLSYDGAVNFWEAGAFPADYDSTTMTVTHIKWEFVESIGSSEEGAVSAYARLR